MSSSIKSCNKYLLYTYCVPGTVLVIPDTVVSQIIPGLIHKELMSLGETDVKHNDMIF